MDGPRHGLLSQRLVVGGLDQHLVGAETRPYPAGPIAQPLGPLLHPQRRGSMGHCPGLPHPTDDRAGHARAERAGRTVDRHGRNPRLDPHVVVAEGHPPACEGVFPKRSPGHDHQLS